MSWLADRVIQHLYRNDTGEELIVEVPAKDEPPTEVDGYKRLHALPFQVNLTFKIQFERNGLIAYKYDQGNGKTRIVSATRENYEKNMGNVGADKMKQMKKDGSFNDLSKSVTTKGYQNAFKQVQEKRGVPNANKRNKQKR